MKNKIIIFLVLAILFTPLISFAAMLPIANLTVIVNTQVSDSSFHFNLSGVQEFNLQTQNLSASMPLTIFAPSGLYLLSQNNALGLKIDNIFCSSNNANDIFLYQPNSVFFTPIMGENITCIFNNIKRQEKTPVLIVPGLLGTEMKSGSELLWPDILRMINPLNTDDFMDPLQFNSNLTTSDNNVAIGDVVKNPEGLFNYTDGLINEFKNQGYAENESLFSFPYDWRYGVSGKYADGKTNSDLLAQKIADILQQTGSDKVDVVAHSLGGLIVKKYVIDRPDSNYIGKVVFVGVPNTGAPKATKVLLQGDNFGVLGLNDSEIKKISENMPASYDLFPSRQYYDADKFISLVDIGYGTDGQTTKNLNYDQAKNFLTADHNLNSLALNNAENFRSNGFDNFDLRTAGVDLYSINGCKSPTIAQLAEIKQKDAFGNYSVKYDVLKETSGDGTVPFGSSDNILINDSNVFYAIKADHGKMPSQDGIRQKIVNVISGSNLSVGSNIISKDVLNSDNAKCQLNGFWLKIFSPIAIEVSDQNGNRSGPVSDGSIQNNIPGADYEIIGEHKFVFIPTDEGQIYTINLTGAGTGNYTIKSQNITNNEVVKTEIFSNLPVTPELTGQISLGGLAGNETTLIVRQNSNSPPETILPSTTLAVLQSQDLLPPVSIATLSGTIGQSNFYRSDVSVNLKATDDLSGVLNIAYNLDNAGFQKIDGDLAIIKITDEKTHTLKFFATDKAGNNEQEQNITFTIDKTPPEVAIEFDPNIKDLKFTSKDNISDKDDVIVLTDQAGNTTEIKFKEKKRKILMQAEIKSIKYNGVSADISKNIFAFLWVYDKNKNFKMLSQYVKSKKEYNILALFDGKNTKIVGKDSSGKISKSFSGLKIIKITTKNGDLDWSY